MKIRKILLAALSLAVAGTMSAGNIVQAAAAPNITILTSAKYDNFIDFSEGLAAVQDKSGWSYIDTTGKVKIGPISEKDFVLIDEEGKTLNKKCKVSSVGKFHEGRAILRGSFGNASGIIVIDKNGKEIFKRGLASFYAGAVFNDYMNGAAVENSFSSDVTITDINGKGTVLSAEKIMGEITSFNGSFAGEGLLSFENANGQSGYVDIKTKKVAIEPKFESVRAFNKGMAPVQLNGKWGFIDKKGKFVINPQYEDFWVMDMKYSYQVFVNDIASVKKNGKWGAIDKNGKVLVDFKYDSGITFVNGMATVKKNGKYSYIDTTGKEVIKPQYDDANYFNKNVALVGQGGTYFLIDKKGAKVNTKTWNFQGTGTAIENPDMLFYKQNGKWGIAKITY